MFIIELNGYNENETSDLELNRYNSIINGLYRKEYGIILYGNGLGKTYITNKLVSNNVVSRENIFDSLTIDNIHKIQELVNENTKFIVEIKDIEKDIPILFEPIYSNSILVNFSK